MARNDDDFQNILDGKPAPANVTANDTGKASAATMTDLWEAMHQARYERNNSRGTPGYDGSVHNPKYAYNEDLIVFQILADGKPVKRIGDDSFTFDASHTSTYPHIPPRDLERDKEKEIKPTMKDLFERLGLSADVSQFPLVTITGKERLTALGAKIGPGYSPEGTDAEPVRDPRDKQKS